LADDAGARTGWNGVVESFIKSDFVEAKRRGDAFLAAAYQTTPYQVLGVQVMLSLSAGAAQARTVLDKKSSDALEALEQERKTILVQIGAQRRIFADGDAVINRLTNNRTVGVQQGSSNHVQCINAQQRMVAAEAAIKDFETRNKEIERQLREKTQSANANLRGDILRLLQMLRDANEIPAAFAIANVYLRRVGTDLEVAKLQQDFVRLQTINDRAVKVVDIIRSKQRSLVEKREYWAAQKEADNILVTVRSQSGDAELPAMVGKLMAADPLSIQTKMKVATSQAAAISKLAEIDNSAARTMFETFRRDFPDYPEMARLEGKVLGEQSVAKKEASEKLVAEIERLVDESPEQAMQLLQTLNEKNLPPTEQQRLGVRIRTVTIKVFHNMLDSLDSDVRSAAGLLGGEALELVAKGRLDQYARIRVDNSAEKPKARAILTRVLASVDRMKPLPLDTPQKVRLDGIGVQAKALQEACK